MLAAHLYLVLTSCAFVYAKFCRRDAFCLHQGSETRNCVYVMCRRLS